MILGVYWYFKFPENLYHFRFFRFFEGYGGHADNDAQLAARVEVNDLENLIRQLEELKLQFPRTYLSLAINGKQLIINIGDHQLFDYHFQFVAAIEDILIRENAILLNADVPFKPEYSKNYQPEREMLENIEHRFIQIVGSDLKKNNAENLSIRIDCNLPLAYKRSFIDDLISICKEENTNVFYYYEHDFEDHCNLMLFFSNGRQRKDAIQTVHVNTLGTKVRQVSQKYPFHFGHFGGLNYYQKNGPHIEMMVDEEYILSKK
ncbi:hypothetical protein EG347_08550 [Chryseobacterium sp. G0186]|uniref:hypothetical protein n=1 Tax=Chryseobacterium sp. G0186 TaxID=2487064 RepID=UPI000F4F6DFA|nr:hypothetical protein [Chryseobacterium sp. G0186]AZA77558.1 hypothetical protein EG347_08550 [Chryseobacterium sp. G0186]